MTNTNQLQTDLLGPALVRSEITEDDEIVKPVCILPNVIELSYYSNCLMQHFVIRSVIATALSAMDLSSGLIREEEVMQNCLDLCEIFQFEFIFCKPCQSKESAILAAIDDWIVQDQVFFQVSKLKLHTHSAVLTNYSFQNNNSDYSRSNRIADELLEDENYVPEIPPYVLNKSEKCLEQIKFYRGLLTPWIEPYFYTALTIEKLIGESLLEGELIKNVLKDMKQQFTEGNVLYGELILG